MNAIYARQSADKADSISIETQIEECLYEVRNEEYKIYTDKGFSGRNTERPEFRLMIEHIKQGFINKVIVYKLDRISRSVLDFSSMTEVFKAFGVEFVSVKEKFDTSNPMGRAMLNIAVVFAELERETIQQRVADAYVSRSRAGYYMGGRVPYGFRCEPVVMGGISTSMYVPAEDEIEHIKLIFDVYSEPAVPLADVIRYLNKNNIVKKRGKEWSVPRISEVLRNPIYVKADADVYNFYASRGTEIIGCAESFTGENGCYLYTKDIRVGGKNMTDNMVLVLAPHRGVIDSDTWLRCRLKTEENRQLPNARKAYRTWLSGKLKCGKCGYAMRYNKWVGKTVENEYYICTGAGSIGRCAGVGAVRKRFIEAEILRLVIEKTNGIEIVQRKPAIHMPVINKIKVAITAKEKEIDEMFKKYEGGGKAVMCRLNRRIEEIESDIRNLKKDLLDRETSTAGVQRIGRDTIKEIFRRWDEISIGNRQAVADILIKRVLVTKETIEVIWKI